MANGMFSYAMKGKDKEVNKKSESKPKGTLFGKPRDQVIKHPGAFSAKAKAAGKSTSAYAKQEASKPGLIGRQARLAEAFATMRAKK